MPVSSILKKYDSSQGKIRKICHDMQIPLPDAGHWQRLKMGWDIENTPLPSTYSGVKDVSLTLKEEGDETTKIKNTITVQPNKDDNYEPSIKVPSKLTNPVRLVVEAKNYLEDKSRNVNEGLVNNYRHGLDIWVSPRNVGRALRFFDTLIKALEVKGISTILKNDTSYAHFDGVEIKIRIKEKWDKVATGKDYPRFDLIPSGRLYFKIDELYSFEWKDGKSLLIEMQLDKIISKIESELIRIKNEALEWQERKKIQAENKLIKEAHERLVSNELLKFNKVLKAAKRWHKARILREYANALSIDGVAIEPEQIDWIMNKADWYDPLVNRADELLKDVDLDNLHLGKNPAYSFFR